jgi:ketosteroid isomerase-like protein
MKIKILFLFIIIKTSVSFGQSEMDMLVDAWHLAASNASFDSYFEVVTDDFVFLGTAPGERWTKDQFAAFSKPYFDKGKAWDFKASNRKWNYSSNGKIAWFDEDLDTWMRGCRGSGVLVKKKGKWKIAYYNLTVLIENEKMKSFIELRDATLD